MEFEEEVCNIPLYGDDGVLVPERVPSPVPERPVEPEVNHSEDGCPRCRGKFVYKRRPVCKKVVLPPPKKEKDVPRIKLKIKSRRK